MYSQPAIYNVLDAAYGMTPGPSGDPTANAHGLQAAIDAAENNGGGIIILPSWSGSSSQLPGLYRIINPNPLLTSAVTISGTNPITFVGTGLGAGFLKLDEGDLFGAPTPGVSQLAFQDLFIKYDQKDAPNPLSGAAFNLDSCSYTRFLRVTFEDCQYPILLTDCLGTAILQCYAYYTVGYDYATLGAAPITVGTSGSGEGSNQTDVDSCIFTVTANEEVFGISPVTVVGVSVTKVDGLRVRNTQISGFAAGLQIIPSGTDSKCKHIVLEGLQVGSQAYGLLVQPVPGAGTPSVTDLDVTNCFFNYDGTPGASVVAGILLDTQGGGNALIDGVTLQGCSVNKYQSHGLEVMGGQNLQVIGGNYSGNGAAAAGIAIMGGAVQVQVVGANATGSYQGGSPQKYGIYMVNTADITIAATDLTGNTQCGIYIADDSSDVTIVGCNVTGNAVNAIIVDGTTAAVTDVFIRGCNAKGYGGYATAISIGPAADVTNVQVTDCVGYNDQSHLVEGVMPTSATNFYGYMYGYYGPVEFYAAPQQGVISTILIGGNFTGLTQGSFFLQPQEAGNITWHTVGIIQPSFFMVGK